MYLSSRWQTKSNLTNYNNSNNGLQDNCRKCNDAENKSVTFLFQTFGYFSTLMHIKHFLKFG